MDLAEQVRDWVTEGEPRLLAELAAWISQPSVSRTGEGMAEAAAHGLELLRRSGLTPQVVETGGWPALVGTAPGPPDSPHVLIYGHYDVQPAGPLHEWVTPPFEPDFRDGRIYGRGTGDNKGQHLAQLLGLRALRDITGGLPCRVTVLLDGEEEIGSPNLAKAVRQLEKPDLVVWSDGPVHESGRASVVLGVRGIVTFELRVRGASGVLHSGNWGGVAPNPAWRLVHVLGTMRDPQGRVLIDGFDDDVVPLSPGEREALAKLPVDVPAVLAGIGAAGMEPPSGPGFYQRLTGPTFSINSLTCEDGGEHRTVVPNVAVAKCDMRLVGGQRVDAVFAAIRAHLERHAPDVEFVPGGAMSPSRTLPETPWTDAVLRGAATGLGEEPLLLPALGGSLPIAAFSDELGVPCYGVPFANVDECNHAPNENLVLDWFRRGVVAAATVQRAIAEVGR
ncbi:acetylornithine deacetylase/succinyl-diaminopimelate desuccinylase-like protein [Saccharothrix tamanrassetensis]|uniref:Acetylornithine deacetylase/succinyl-diaminopimelate desuccinylase-like protein n=1 Tax=Saccharothrix tamanrassetensis TaxID=1051531 RepID=A0A841CTF1_9PSEU|nr:M20/M25/M40 family metallo-hydrolase [Saccharothrix tamanrassetensis]MBB5960143.1 acetylornithine deacetylase/succinyl-diaminopimelate desuccinylase-like protein [Saccharothrix tamanrassetensis]